jgi:MacB-like periplasmic core domain
MGITDTLMPSVVRASVDLFDTYGAQILAGRNLAPGDVGAANTVVVNRSFAEMYLEDANALGLRFRYVRDEEDPAAPAPWYQIVGVVRDFPAFPPNLTRTGEPTIYHPAAAGDLDPVVLSVRLTGAAPAGFINRVREIGAGVDPTRSFETSNRCRIDTTTAGPHGGGWRGRSRSSRPACCCCRRQASMP